MSSHSSGSSSAPPPPPPTPPAGGSGSGGGVAVGVIKLVITAIAILGITAGVLPNLPPGAFKVIGIVIAIIIGLVVLLAIMGGGSGEGGGHGASGFVIILAIIAAWAVGLHVIKAIQAGQKSGHQQQGEEGGGTTITSPSGVVEKKVLAYPGTNYTSFVVGTGTNMWWVVDHPTESVMYHFDREKPEDDKEDSKNGPMRVFPQMTREYTAHIRAKGLISVAVTVYLTPIRP